MIVQVYESHPDMHQEWTGIIGELLSDRPEPGSDRAGYRVIQLKPNELWLAVAADPGVRETCLVVGTVRLGGVKWKEVKQDGRLRHRQSSP